jgi:hypothetical protein
MPADTIYVGRPTRWGNPFNFKSSDHGWTALAFGSRADAKGRQEAAVKAFRAWIDDPSGRVASIDVGLVLEGGGKRIAIGPRATAGTAPSHDDIRNALRGKNLACWCRLDQPCHADVLLEIANR